MIFSALSPLMRSGLVQGMSRDALMRMEPETAHRATISALKLGLMPTMETPDAAQLKTEICGLPLNNPIGMAAGFDKNAEVPKPLMQIGFGFVEVGTLTPRPQTGNPTPRVFRLPEVNGVINRLGFNNEGHDAALERLKNRHMPGVLGINVGANKDSDDFVADYVLGIKRFASLADYLTVNISSPNTPGLRNLQSDEALKRLLMEVLAERARATTRVPVFLKIAPDLDETELDAIAKTIAATDLDGLIVSNTTITRDLVEGIEGASETGGLSGQPLFNLATQKLAQTRQRVGDLPIIGVGGIHSGASAVAKLAAGANAIQLYSALVYGGMEMLEDIKLGLTRAIDAGGHKSVADLSSTAVDDWASGKAQI